MSNEPKLSWRLTEGEYQTVMKKAIEIGATHLYAFADRHSWFHIGGGEPKNAIYEKLVDGQWFHYVKNELGDMPPKWIIASDGFNGGNTIALYDFYKYVSQEEEVAVPSANLELKDALFVVLRAGYTVVPPQTKE